MEGNDCNKAIKIVTALAIILFVFGASTIIERNQLQKENAQLKEEKGLRIESIPIKTNVLPASDNRPAPSENISIAKPINFSLGREYVEAMLKQQNPNKTISFKEIWCDATLTYYDPTTTENDGSCYVTYSLGDWNYTVVAVDKQYKDDWW